MAIQLSGSLEILGNIIASGGITGSFSGSATSASFASTLQGLGSASFAPAGTFNIVSQSFATTSGSIASRVNVIETSYATTGSNNFTKPQQISDVSNAISFTSTASLYTDGGLRVKGSSFVSGTAYFNDVVVYGTSSIEYITSSQLAIGTNIITLNTDTPSIRFGGISVFDSGSNNLSTGSLFWDSEKDKWIYSNPSASTYDGGMLISGPRNTLGLGNEVGTTSCALMMGQGGDHITSSAIFSYGNATCFYGASAITSTGVGCFSGAVCASNITSTGTICSTGNTCFGGTVILAGNVGIGTASPTVKLHVSGSGTTYGKIEGVGNNTTGLLTQNSNKQYFAGTYYNVVDAWEVADITANGCTRLTITSTGIATFACQVCVPQLISTGTVYAGPTSKVGFGTPGAERGAIILNAAYDWSINTNSIACAMFICSNNGSIGIGTSSPSQLLHLKTELATASGVGTAIQIESGGAGGDQGWIGVNKGTGNGLEISVENRDIIFNTGATSPFSGNERMRIASGGLVSINQTSGYGIFNITGIDCGWGEGIIMNPAPNGYNAINFRLEGRTGSCVTGTWQLGKISSGETSSGEAFTLNKQGLTGGTAYRVDASQQWKTNGDSVFGFKVGIGTCSPSTLLHVNTPRTSGTNVDIMTLSDNVTGIQTSGFGVRILATSNNGQAKSAIAFEADGGTNNDTAIAFYTQTSAASLDRRMTINKFGNIIIGSDKVFGINTTDGSDNGYLALTGAGADGEARGGHIYLSGNERSSDPGTVVLSAGNVSGGSVIIRTGAGTERMRVTNGGIIYALTAGVDGTYCPMIGGMYTSNNNETNLISTAVSSNATQSGFRFDVSNGAGSSGRTTSMYINRSSVTVVGSLSKGSGTFNIEHPLESRKCTHRLVHSFIEGPQADLIYRGVTNLINGIACVNIDCAARMSEGTFEALNRCAQVFTTNESSWDAIRGKIHGNILVIESQNTSSTDEISWMVIGERQDKHIRETSITDEFGRIVVEPEIREDEKFTCICNQ